MCEYLGSSCEEIIGECDGTEFLAETAACKGKRHWQYFRVCTGIAGFSGLQKKEERPVPEKKAENKKKTKTAAKKTAVKKAAKAKTTKKSTAKKAE